jgi:anhydro-N-acetylmuramic acid kinase
LNIGGIANVSCKTGEPKSIVAFDICAANQVLNSLANRLSKEYDAGGELAKQGKVHQPLLKKLNELDFYRLDYPKSLDNGYSRELILPLIEGFDISVNDKLCTYTEHIATQVAGHIKAIAAKEKMNFGPEEKMLATGGGAFNSFLIERIKQLANIDVIVPAEELVKFKEALVIAFMGVLRMRNEVNVLKSVTGAKKDSIAGAVYRP